MPPAQVPAGLSSSLAAQLLRALYRHAGVVTARGLGRACPCAESPMDLPAGQVIARVGHNGSGKTTLAKLEVQRPQPALSYCFIRNAAAATARPAEDHPGGCQGHAVRHRGARAGMQQPGTFPGGPLPPAREHQAGTKPDLSDSTECCTRQTSNGDPASITQRRAPGRSRLPSVSVSVSVHVGSNTRRCCGRRSDPRGYSQRTRLNTQNRIGNRVGC
ncbi:MAG: hypothetical protein QOJ06_471 [Pseudonocardiales bacterium]|nr:hypothetical protein [Pseudonocardiales bacterium]